MNTDKKLEYFTQAISKEIESKKRTARKQMANEMNEAIAHAVAQAETEAADQIQAQHQLAQKANNKRVSQAQAQARRDLAALREQLTAQLFEGIQADIQAFTLTPGYEDFLIESIKLAQSQVKHNFTYVQLPPGTSHLSQKIQEVTGLTPEPGDENDIGGYKLLTENRNMTVDNTFKARIASAVDKAIMTSTFKTDRSPQ